MSTNPSDDFRPSERTPTGRPTKAAINRRLNELFVEFGGVAGYRQLRYRVGLSDRQILRRVGSGELVDRTSREEDERLSSATVFARDEGPLTLAGARWRGLMSAPQPAFLGDLSACALYDTVKPDTNTIYVVHPGGNWEPPPGVVAVRTTRSTAADFTREHRFPSTTFGRSVTDAAAHVDAETIDDILDRAISLRIYDERDMRRAIAVRKRFPGNGITEAALARLDDKSGEFQSKFERLTMRLLQQSTRLPPAVVNVLVEGYRPDIYFPGTRAILECDGDDYHRSDAQRIADEERAQRLWQMGFVIKPLRWKQVKYEAETTLPNIERWVLANLAPPVPRR